MIRAISASEALPLRKKILRPQGPFEECHYPGDDSATSLHLGEFSAGQLVGVATFYSEPSPDFPTAQAPYRLRGMAVDHAFHRRGVGKRILQQGEEELLARGCDLLWFNARENAFAFYLSMGFHLHGPLFEIRGIGPHKVMYKTYAPR